MTQFLVGLLQGGGGQQGIVGMLLPMVLIFGVFFLLVIRPQQKKAKEHQQMLNQLKAGDEVVTNGGILGKITGIRDDEAILQVQEGVRIRVLRSAITGRHVPGGAVAKPGPKPDVKAS